MNAYRIPGRTEIDDIAAEARRDARRLQLQERLRLIDALIGSPERSASGGGAAASASFGGPFVLIGLTLWWGLRTLWWSHGDLHPLITVALVAVAFVAFGFLIAFTCQALFHVSRFVTRRSLAKLQ